MTTIPRCAPADHDWRWIEPLALWHCMTCWLTQSDDERLDPGDDQ